MGAVASRLLINLSARVPGLLAGAQEVAYVDIDGTIGETYGYAKQGSGYGYSGVKGLNALVATICTPAAAPVISGTRTRQGSCSSACGAASMITETCEHCQAGPGPPGASRRAPTAPSATTSSSRRYAEAGRVSRSPPVTIRRPSPRSPASPRMPGLGSSIPRPSGTKTRAGGYLMPRSPRSPTLTSPPARRTSTSPPG